MPNDRKQEETSLLVDSQNGPSHRGLFAQKPYTILESCIHGYLSCCQMCRGLDEFQQASEEGIYTIPDKILAFRADTRRPELVFDEGFSAYAFQRMEMCPNCNDLSVECCCQPRILTWFACLGLCSPFIATVGTFNLLKCLWYGSVMYDDPYVTRWPALSLSANMFGANAYTTASDNVYRYMACLDGALNFNGFSNDVIKDQPWRDPSRYEDWGAHDVGEIIPKDLNDQTISNTQIIGCVVTNKNPDNNQEIEGKITFILNPNFKGLAKIKSKFSNLSTDDFPKVELSKKEFEELQTEIKTLFGLSTADTNQHRRYRR